jgi:hypothetical protein
VPLAYDVQRKLEALEAAFADLARTGAELEKLQRAAALAQVVEWSRMAGKELDKRALAALAPYLEGSSASHWKRALKMVETYAPRVAKSASVAAELADRLAALKGDFPAELAADVRAAQSDASKLAQILADAPRRPARWLASSYFRW